MIQLSIQLLHLPYVYITLLYHFVICFIALCIDDDGHNLLVQDKLQCRVIRRGFLSGFIIDCSWE